MNIAEAVTSLRPGAIFTIDGRSYDGINWLDKIQTKPTREEVELEIVRLQSQYDNKLYQRQRANEYPDFKDYLDGVVKGDQAQIQAYIDACLAVKDKYPKP